MTEFTIDYTECDKQGSTLSEMPASKWNCGSASLVPAPARPKLTRSPRAAAFADKLASGHSDASVAAPQWSYTTDTSAAFDQQQVCTIEYSVPYDLCACSLAGPTPPVTARATS